MIEDLTINHYSPIEQNNRAVVSTDNGDITLSGIIQNSYLLAFPPHKENLLVEQRADDFGKYFLLVQGLVDPSYTLVSDVDAIAKIPENLLSEIKPAVKTRFPNSDLSNRLYVITDF